ncbi:LytTR family DNA-binding domain-containing protein [Altererythrobacter arenosus]|uniref:LytTR family DNA-binding domain-containing protein n=1 Tax=Altererythrobacter arenosus TaxID=3032592 RepID=A0ABY8FM85_9SPHN|nr:LytTR family DNA-binding domain-containing protein [Altererythrobacter sp. CAU 1644]WFL76134.1 LytTR family DNA-binding domain-containing protein [Altererythrobacter sp. CAU 1644]
MSLRLLIVDDEQLAIDRLQELLSALDNVTVVGTANNARAAKAAIAELCPDLVLLDIQMPGGSGMALAADLPAERRPEIAFVTAFENFAPDAFAVDAIDYLLKPVRFDRLRQAIVRAQRRKDLVAAAQRGEAQAEEASRFVREIWVTMRDGQVRVDVAMIDWIEAAKDYVLLHTATRSYLHRMSMNALEDMLDPKELMRVHRSAFVRPARVNKLERPGKGSVNLVLCDGVSVQVGPSYVKEVLRAIGPEAA